MNYSNLFDDTKISKKHDRKATMYFNSIGNKADELLEKALRHAGFTNAKIKQASYGNFKAYRYSFRCDESELDYMVTKFYNYLNGRYGNMLILKQNKYNIYVMEHINFD